MKHDESNIISDRRGPLQLQQLDRVFAQVLDTLENSRHDIFDISQDCEKQCANLDVELEDINKSIKQIIADSDRCEYLEKQARIRLMEVSKRFSSMSEDDIKQAYENARAFQVKVLELRQQENYLKKRREEIEKQIRQFREISNKASDLLNSTAMAIKLMQGNADRISGTIEQVFRKQQLELWVIESQESERRKIAREIHDGPAQSLASMLIRLDLIMRMKQDITADELNELGYLKQIGQESLTDVRRIMYDLKPALINEKGLSRTLKDYFNEYEAKYDFMIDYVVFGSERQYDLALEVGLFRLVQEAITNVRKHAGVNKALVKLEDTGSLLTLVIKDEGGGFDPQKVGERPESYGIMGMKERVQLFGGELEILSEPGTGTQVIIKVPLEGEANHGEDQGNHR